jgi:hypothetical protein
VTLLVTLQDGQTANLRCSDGMTEDECIQAFIHEREPFNQQWVRLADGGYVKRSYVVLIRPGGAGLY